MYVPYLSLSEGCIQGENLVLGMFPHPLTHTQVAHQRLTLVTENGRHFCLMINTKCFLLHRLVFDWSPQFMVS